MQQKIEFTYTALSAQEKELYDALPESKKRTFENSWTRKAQAERALRRMRNTASAEKRKRIDRRKYELGGLLMKYTGGKTEWSEVELQRLERYLDQYQNAIKSYIQNPQGVVSTSEFRG